MHGRISKDKLSLISKLEERDVYIFGPQGFMDSSIKILQFLGAKKEKIYKEHFGLRKILERNKKAVSILLNNKEIKGDNQSFLLEQAEKNWVQIPYKCRAGLCGKCKVQLISGEVDHLEEEALSEIERREGFILSCCSIPILDIQVRF